MKALKKNGWKSLSVAFFLAAALVISTTAFAEEPYDPVTMFQPFKQSYLNQEIIPRMLTNTGAATFGIPIEVPPGRGGIAVPELVLRYNHGGQNGWVGVGWDLDAGSIQRATKHGLDYNGTDFLVNGSIELVSRSNEWGSGYYGAKIEEAFTKYKYISSSSGWVAYRKDGTLYYYGRTTASRQSNTNGVFKWCLDKVEDSNGNTMTLTYEKDLGQIYLKRIDYTGNKNYLIFDTVDRPDVVLSYKTYAEVKTAKRLSRIRVYGNGQLSRQYDLTYENGTSSGRSRLIQVTPTLLPPTTFEYQEGGNGAFDESYDETTADSGDTDRGYVNFADVNGDGYTDFVMHTAYGRFFVYRSLGDGYFNTPGQETVATEGSADPGNVHYADVNGDGNDDLIMHTSYGRFFVYRSLGNGYFNTAAEETVATAGSTDTGYVHFADVNGDGLADLIMHTAYGRVYVYRSLGNGYFNTPGEETADTDGSANPGYVNFVDVNGDGLADLIMHTAYGRFYTHLSLGNGYFNTPGEETVVSAGSADPGYVHFADANGDGLTDLISRTAYGRFYTYFSSGNGSFITPGKETEVSEGSTDRGYVHFADVTGDGLTDLIMRTAYGRFYVYRSLGDGYFNTPGEETVASAGSTDNGYVHFADVTGDGLTDLIMRTAYGRFYTYKATGNPPDLLNTVDNGLGYSADITYEPSSSYVNTLLPFIVQTVSTIAVNDGLGTVSSFSYDYVGGYYDAPDRDFRGFEKTDQTNPNNTVLISLFYQTDDHLKGRKYRTDFKNPSNSLQARIDNTWNKHSFTEAAFVKLIQKRIDIYSGTTVYRQHAYDYNNANGNLKSVVMSGSNSDPVTTAYQYDKFGTWLWRKIEETIENSSGQDIRKTLFDYENSTGNMLYEERWLSGGPYASPRTNYTYDSYGNVVTETDARGNTTTYAYETVLHTHPSLITYPQTGGVDHIVAYPAYDYRFGKPTAEIDENGHQTTYVYDAIGRLTRVDYPDGGQETRQYVDSSVPRYTLTKVKEEASSTIDRYEYFDGLARPVQTITFGEDAKTIVTRQYYDNMGRNYLNRGPYFSTGTGYPKNPPASHPYAQTTFDYYNRPVRIDRPDGSYGTVSTTLAYNGYSTTFTDPDGSQKTEKRDYLERITRVTEHGDTENIFTYYEYNAAGDLLTITDHYQNIIAMVYDTLGRKISMNDPDLGNWQYTYDPNDNLQTQTDARGQQIEFHYDELDRLTLKDYLNTSDNDVSYAYDNTTSGANGIGRLFTVANTVSTITYGAYDEMGRQLEITKSIQGAPASDYTTEYEYDLAGQVSRLIYPDGYEANFSYFPGSGLLNQVTGPAPDFEDFAELDSYQPTGKIGSIYFGNNAATTYAYDAKSTRLLSIQTLDSGLSEILKKNYTYSKAGDVKSIVDNQAGGSITYNYTYDKLHRLLSETNTGTADNFAAAVLESTHDAGGPVHAPASINVNGADHFYAFDANGNMDSSPDFRNPAQVAERTITYDADNMPSRIEHDSGGFTTTVNFAYDGDGRRVKKEVTGGSTTYYIGDHFEVIGGVETRYIFAGNLRIAKVTGASRHFFHKDHLGSSSVMTDYPNGLESERTAYMPFGQERAQPGIQSTGYRFTDQELDAKTGLYNYDARLYDPVIGNFITADNIIPDQYDPQLLNRYSYTRNNPLKYVDPDGHVLETAWDVANIGIGAYSLYSNIKTGSWGGAAFDAGGLVIDIAAAVIPFVPGGAGTAIKVARAADKGAELAKKADALSDTKNIVKKSGKVAKDPTPKKVPNPGGRLGKQSTRDHIDDVATEMERRGWEITGGGNRLPEEYLPGPGGARKGSSYPDITATKNGRTLRVNTVDTRANGITPTTREATNAARIRSQTPGAHLLLIPKP